MKYVAWLWRNMAGMRFNAAVRIVFGVARVALGLLMVCLSKHFIDVTIKTGSNEDIVEMIVLLVLTVVGGIVLRQVYFYLTALATVKKTNALRLELFGGYFFQQLYGEDKMHSGDVTSRLTKDIEVVGNVMADTIPQMAVTGIQLVGAFLLMRWFDARLAWALLLFTPVAIVLGKLVAHRLRKMTLDIREGESRIQMHVQEGVEHNAVLRSLGSEQWMTDRLDVMQRNLEGNVLRRSRFTVIARFMLGCAFGLGYMMAFVWGGLGLRSGAITFGVMTSFLQLVGQIQQPILSFLNMVPQVIHATASMDRLEEIRTASQKSEDGKAMLLSRVGITAEDVAFRYAKGDRNIVEHFSHEFKPGSKTALMGETGAGKTTLFRLILGFVKPESGKILVWESPEGARMEADEDTRGNFVFVPQGNSLMSGTIRYNLLIAKPDATEDELRHALHTACAEFVDELPDGIDTELGERGCGLSEGQSQRIAIARGLLRPGAAMLLDEISSSLDEKTEKELFRRLFEAFPQKTMVFITHRRAVVDLCDSVVEL